MLSSAPEDGQNNCPKHVELTGVFNKPLLLHLIGCLYYLHQWCTVKQISDIEIYLFIKYIKSVLWRVAKHLSHVEDARCLKVNTLFEQPILLIFANVWRITPTVLQFTKIHLLLFFTFSLSQLSLVNKLLVYKAILKPIWTYSIQMWGSASNSNLKILKRFQSKVLRIITDALWYVPKCGDKTWLTSVIGSTRSAKLQCHLPTKAWQSPQQPGKIFI